MIRVAQKLAYERVQLEEQITNLNTYIDQLKVQHQNEINNLKGSTVTNLSTSRDMMTLLKDYNHKIDQLEQQNKESLSVQ